MFSNLAWLPDAPADFRDLLGRVKGDVGKTEFSDNLWSRAKALAAFHLDEVQLSQVARVVRAFPEGGDRPRAHKIGIIGDGTLSLLGPAIVASALRQDMRLEIVEGVYGAPVQDAIDPDSELRRAQPEIVVLAADRRGLGLNQSTVSSHEAAQAVEAAIETVTSICEGLQAFVPGAIVLQTIVPPLEPFLGSFDLGFEGSAAAQVGDFNRKLRSLAAEKGYILMDVARLAGAIGLERWDDPQQWYAAKLPFAADMIPAYADLVARTLGAIYGKSRKCLVIDLDNTIWGGVIGDDGLAGIALGQGSAAGEAFLSVQRAVLDLRNRGVVIAVCTKNDEENARRPFVDHTEMLLRLEHIAVFQSNWIDKAANLRTIATTLNLGLDALVFLDDNPVERAQVRAELPMVAVPELPESPALYARTLLAAGYFEAVTFSDDDRRRADNYQANSERLSLKAQASDMVGYLRSLNMVCTIRRFDPEGRARIAQLINKSNQFNLTTRRYTEAEVARIEPDPGKYALQIRLTDRFGDNGMISVVIVDVAKDAWTIDTWLMSCRVLGRGVETAILRHLVAAAKAAGAKALRGVYIPSGKNNMVSNHYGKLGFQEEKSGEATTYWRLELNDYVESSPPMEVDD